MNQYIRQSDGYLFTIVRENEKQIVISVENKRQLLKEEEKRFEYINKSSFTTLEKFAENY